MKSTLALCLAAGACMTQSARAVDLYLINTQNVDLLCDSLGNPDFFIGNNPSVISLVGNDLYVGGYNNTGVAAPGQVVKIEGIDFTTGTRLFRLMPDTQVTLPAFRGYYGCTFDWGTANSGLVVNYDSGGVGTAGAFKLFDVTTQLNPILLQSSPAGTSPRGGAGTSFDYGNDGLGFDLDGNGSKDGPVIGLLDFSNYGGVQSRGPFGIRTAPSIAGGDALTAIGTGRIYDGNSVDGSSNSIAAIMNIADLSGCTISSTLWRDLAIDRTNGDMAGRAANDLVLVKRNALNGNASIKNVDLNGGCGSGGAGGSDSFAFAILQRAEAVYGYGGPSFVIINDLNAAGSSLSTWTKAFDFDGAPVTLSFKNPDGSTFDPAIVSSTFDFSWDPTNKRLAISTFGNRNVYIFSTEPPVLPCACTADFDGSGGTPDSGDIDAFFTAWLAGEANADADCSGGTPDAGDIDVFFGQWLAGGC
jgi:hypothetical protein